MAGPTDQVNVAPASPRHDSHPVPVTRPRGRLVFLLPLPLAAAAGLGAGASPQTALAVTAAVVSAAVLVTRVEWAALAVIGAGVFEGYLALLSPWATDWLAAVLLVAWAVRRAQGPLHDQRLRSVALPVVALAGSILVAFVVHPNGAAGLQSCAKYAELAIVMLVLADVLCGPLAPRRAARLYVLACVAASSCGIVTAVLSERHRVVGPVENADTLAFFLVAALPLVGTVRTRREQPVWPIWACFAVLLAAGVGTQSRAALVAVVAMILVAVLTGLLALRHAGALLAVVTTAAALVIAVLPLPIGQALTDPQRYSDTNIAQRNDMRMAAFEMTRASPVVGLGPGAFPLFHQDYRDDDDQYRARDLDTAYSIVLETSAELGLLGVLSLYAVWIVPAAAARRRWLGNRARLTAGVLLAFDGLLIASLLVSEPYVLPLWFMAAMAFALGRPGRVRRPIFGGGWVDRSSGQVVVRS
jgi:putative inorganic carbon (hco3(-)) transporter